MEYVSGNTYTGDWANDNYEGHGVLIFKSGKRYEGEFKAGYWHGKGHMEYSNGVTYTGDWANDKHEGHGVLVSKSGGRYEIIHSHDMLSIFSFL